MNEISHPYTYAILHCINVMLCNENVINSETQNVEISAESTHLECLLQKNLLSSPLQEHDHLLLSLLPWMYLKSLLKPVLKAGSCSMPVIAVLTQFVVW